MTPSKPVVRCSGLDQLLSCPGSATLIRELGCKRGDDTDSWEGSYCHYEAAMRLVGNYGAIPPERGLERPNIPADYQPAPHALRVVDYYVRSVLDSSGGNWAMEVEGELLAEFPAYWLSGHVDFLAINSDATELFFADLKTGIIPVDAAEQNEQILGYSTLLKLAWPSLKKITGRVVQPRLSELTGPRETEVILEGDQLEGIAAFLDGRINQALLNPMELSTGSHQCRWCSASLRCPAISAEIKYWQKVLANPDA